MAEYIDTGVRPDTITITDTEKDRVIMRYECVPHRHFKAEVVEDINEETCKAVREKLFAQGYTDVLLLGDEFIREAIGKALREKAMDKKGKTNERDEAAEAGIGYGEVKSQIGSGPDVDFRGQVGKRQSGKAAWGHEVE